MSISGLSRKESAELRKLLMLDKVVTTQRELFRRAGNQSMANAATTASNLLFEEQLPLLKKIIEGKNTP